MKNITGLNIADVDQQGLACFAMLFFQQIPDFGK